MPQSLAHLGLHIVFSTKNRRSWLESSALRDSLYAYISGVLRGHDSPAVIIGGTSNHIHVLCLLSRKITVAELIKETKRTATLWLREKTPDCRDFQWQAGYAAFSVSASSMEQVRQYILHQEEHHREMDFSGEFRKLLEKHGIEYDERYVWD